METIKISELERNGLQTRVALDEQTVEDYADAMRGRAKFPPVIVFRDNAAKKLYLADGFHRVEAAQRAGFKAVKAEVRIGSFTDALMFALGANAIHGLRRSNADKQRTLEMAWAHRRKLWPREDNADPSAAILSEVCGVSIRKVNDFLSSIQPMQNAEVEKPKKAAPTRKAAHVAPIAPVRKVFGKDGRTRDVPEPVNTAPTRKAAPVAPVRKGHAPGVLLDRFGVEVPMEIKDAFAPSTVRDEIEASIRQASTLLKSAMDAKDPSVAQFRQADLIDLQNALRTAKFTRPYCVCRICQGNGRGSCTACHETGFQTEEQYKRNPKEFR